MGIFNKVVVITGAGTGLGAAAAEAFGKEGAIVVLVGRRKDKIEAVASSILKAGGQALAVQADVSIETDVSHLAETVKKQFGRADVLINNAAVFEPGQVIETSISEWSYQLAVNLTGPFLVTKAFLPLLRAAKSGRIVNVTSGLAQNGAGGFAAYSASKAGLESLTRTTADDESRYGILANLFNPGQLKTDMHASGRDPQEVTGELLKLADLPADGPSGKLFEAGN